MKNQQNVKIGMERRKKKMRHAEDIATKEIQLRRLPEYHSSKRSLFASPNKSSLSLLCECLANKCSE
jgi:hypothetical protein